jgi:hypothetical protein
MRKTISMAYSEKVAAQKGFKPAPKDHPIYSEGLSITFLHHTRKPSHQKAIASHQKGSKKATD